MSNKKSKGELTYFLDHPQIKRHKSPGNGNSPGFFNQMAAGKLKSPSSSSTTQTSPSGTRAPASTASSSSSSGSTSGQSSWQKAFSKGFKGD